MHIFLLENGKILARLEHLEGGRFYNIYFISEQKMIKDFVAMHVTLATLVRAGKKMYATQSDRQYKVNVDLLIERLQERKINRFAQ
jgi:hypothetical protein